MYLYYFNNAVQLLEKPGKPLVFRQGMKGQNLSFIISSIRLFFLNEVAKTPFELI